MLVRLSHNIVTWVWITTFQLLSGDDVDWLSLIKSSTVAVGYWCISILTVVVNDWRISIPIVLTRCCASRICCATNQLLCCLIVDIHVSGILVGWSLMWTLLLPYARVYQCDLTMLVSLDTIPFGTRLNLLTKTHIGTCARVQLATQQVDLRRKWLEEKHQWLEKTKRYN